MAEYLALENRSEERNEYRDGEILNMPGGTFAHEGIISNLIRRIGERLDGTGCLVRGSNLKVRTDRGRFLYPDLTVTCGTPIFDPPEPQVALVNPQVIVEVLSPSTESADRGEKFFRYARLPSLQDYILVFQDRPRAEMLYRLPDGLWSGLWSIGGYVEGLDAAVPIRSLSVDVPLAQVYAGVTFPPSAVAPDSAAGEGHTPSAANGGPG